MSWYYWINIVKYYPTTVSFVAGILKRNDWKEQIPSFTSRTRLICTSDLFLHILLKWFIHITEAIYVLYTRTEPPEAIRPDSEIFQRPSLGREMPRLGVFLGNAEPKSWVSLSRVKVDIMKILCFNLMKAIFFINLAPNYTFSVRKSFAVHW